MKTTLLDLLNRLRNPDTGWWGERYEHEGRVDFVDDLSITFHLVSYLKGDVPNLDKVAKTLLQLKDLEYPVGWLGDGRYSTHHNMDVVVLFKYAWPHMSETQRQAASIEIEKMQQWCLRDAILPDGSFREGSSGEDSLEENEYFGVAFLVRAGYFDPSGRFWTQQPFPEAEKLRLKLIEFIQRHKASGAAGGAYYESALRELGTRSTMNYGVDGGQPRPYKKWCNIRVAGTPPSTLPNGQSEPRLYLQLLSALSPHFASRTMSRMVI